MVKWKKSLATNYEGSYSDYSDACSAPSPPPSRQWRVFSVPREWCQHGPLKAAAVRSKMNALAEHNGPNLNTTRIYARSESQQKKEGYSAPIQPCCYFIRAVNLFQLYISFVVFKCLWSLKHVQDLTGLPPFSGDGILFLSPDWAPWLCLCVWLQIYTDWANHYLAKSGNKRLIKDLQTDVADGVLLAEIIQVVGKEKHTFDSMWKGSWCMWLLTETVHRWRTCSQTQEPRGRKDHRFCNICYQWLHFLQYN